MAIERALCPVLVGRERELGLLEDALLATLRGEGRVVVLAGDAGMGKTRLATEVSRRAARIGCAALAGSCSEAELALPYLPFAEALGNYLATTDLDQLRVQLGPAARELAQLFPQLGRVRAAADGGDPAQGKLRLFEAILGLLRIAAAERGLLLVIEDVHWIDASARELLDYLSRRLEQSRIVVLVTYRRGELDHQHPLLPTIQAWKRSGLATVVELEPMSHDGVAEMMRAIFDEARVTDEFRDFMHSRSEGNPFVLEEVLKTALDRKDIYLSLETGTWERKALPQLDIPPTVRDMILLRVGRLSAAEAEVLRAAAVLGRSFDYSILMVVAGQEQSIVEAALHAATGQQLVEEDPLHAGQYRFRHALTQEAIYQDLSAPQRERLHLAAAEALRARAGAGAAEVAYHLMAANRWAEAEPVCLAVAEEAQRRRGYREAATLYARMLPHLSDPVQQGRVRCLLGEAHLSAGDYGEALASLQEGIRVLDQRNEGRQAAHHRLTLGRCYSEQSRPAAARAEFERARTLLEPEGPSEDLAFAYVSLARLHIRDEENREALALVDRGIDVAVAAGADAPRIWAYNYRGCALASLGHTAEGLADLDRSYQEAVQRDLDWIASVALINSITTRVACFRLHEALEHIQLLRAFGGPYSPADIEIEIHCNLGEPAMARQVGEETLPLARRAEASTLVSLIEIGLGIANSALGRFEEAHRFLAHQASKLERGRATHLAQATMRLHLDQGDIVNALPPAQSALADVLQRPELSLVDVELIDRAVEVFVQAGMAAEATQLLDRARTVPVQADNPYLSRIEGRLALAQGDLDRAQDCLQAAVDFFAQASYRDDEWRTRRALAEVKTQLGDGVGAEAELRAVLSASEEHGHITEATAARKQLLEMGVVVAPAPTAPAAKVPEAPPGQIGERFVTVMFIDVRGYTTIAATAAPSDLADRVAAFYRWTEQEVARHRGQVAQYGGDALMATFNVSGMRLDHCLHALQAGLVIRDKAAYNELPVGVGIAVGPAIVGQLSQASPVTTIGETSNLAARLQTAAKPGEIVLSVEAFRRVRDWVHAQHLEARDTTLSLKGFESAVAAFVLPSHAPAATA
jgi:predicted ATPase/class 3 adenylate cyclase